MTNYELVRQWMQDNAADYDDGIDINCTALAEDAAYEFDIYECDEDTVPDDTYPIPEWVYELAFDVSEWYLSGDDEFIGSGTARMEDI